MSRKAADQTLTILQTDIHFKGRIKTAGFSVGAPIINRLEARIDIFDGRAGLAPGDSPVLGTFRFDFILHKVVFELFDSYIAHWDRPDGLTPGDLFALIRPFVERILGAGPWEWSGTVSPNARFR